MPKRYLNLNSAAWRRIRNAYPVTSATYRSRAFMLTLAEQMQSSMTVAERDISDPIFVVGHWRSGTTLLHELLCASGDYGYPTTFACMTPQAFLANPLAKPSSKSTTRPMDKMRIDYSSPQEDEFAMLCLGASSPYEVLLWPQGIGRVASLSNPDNWTRTELDDWIATFRKFLATCQLAAGGRRLVVKSPAHSFRIALLRELFPRSCFICIERNAEEVFVSTRAMWESMWNLYALGPRPARQTLNEAICDTMALLCEEIARARTATAPERFATIQYEELVRDPLGSLREICHRLRMAFPAEPGPELRERITQAATYKARSHRLSDEERRMLRVRLCGSA